MRRSAGAWARSSPRAFVERLVLPTVMEPLREEWDGVRSAAEGAMRAGNIPAAAEFVRAFHGRLCTIQVLDPACGSGNFLYVTLELMKRLEGEVLDALNGKTPPAEPILHDFGTIRRMDALLAHDGEAIERDKAGRPVTAWGGRTRLHPTTGKLVPDENDQVGAVRYLNERQAAWPDVDFIVGNPPFVAGKDLKAELGSGYAKALRAAYPKVLPSVDLAMFFWWRAARAMREGNARRFGFITSNSVRQVFCRRVIAAAMEAAKPLHLAFAVPNHPWSQDVGGAAVRSAMTVAMQEDKPGRLLVVERESAGIVPDVVLAETFGVINADLTIGVTPDLSKALRANEKISSRGVLLHGAGFIVSYGTAAALGLGRTLGLGAHIRPYLNGKDTTGHSRDVMVIDLFGLTEGEVRQRFPALFQYLLLHVKPRRDARATSDQDSEEYARHWWLHGESRPGLRAALHSLPRYITTVETSKHRIFIFQPAGLIPDNRLVCVASSEAWPLGVLSSAFHVRWALFAGALLENRPVYTKTTCFDLFPFPCATDAQVSNISAWSEELDLHRKTRLVAHPNLTMTVLYNVLVAIRTGQSLSNKDKDVLIHGQVELLRHLHDRLDQAVADAYGWPAELPAAEIVARVVALNRERAAEEAAVQVRWLRPAFQAPSEPVIPKQQLAITIDPAAMLPAWPKQVPAQYVALRAALAGKGITSPDALAQHFSGVRPAKLAPMLKNLAALGQARDAGSGRFAT